MPLRWRPDGDYVRDLPRLRRIMPFLMRGSNESAVYFEQKIDVSRTDTAIRRLRDETGLHVRYLHLIVYALVRTLAERPRLNRFVAGNRVFQRRGIWISFSGKKAKTDRDVLVTVKRRFEPAWSFERVYHVVEGDIAEARNDTESTVDRELKWLFRLPAWLVGMLVRAQVRLDHWGLLPASFYRNDPLYASLFIANLGSIGMDSAYHHLYEYGNIPVFMTVGRVRNEVVPEGGGTRVAPCMTVRYTFDERIEDGLYCSRALDLFKGWLEDPERLLAKEAPAHPTDT